MPLCKARLFELHMLIVVLAIESWLEGSNSHIVRQLMMMMMKRWLVGEG